MITEKDKTRSEILEYKRKISELKKMLDNANNEQNYQNIKIEVLMKENSQIKIKFEESIRINNELSLKLEKLKNELKDLACKHNQQSDNDKVISQLKDDNGNIKENLTKTLKEIDVLTDKIKILENQNTKLLKDIEYEKDLVRKFDQERNELKLKYDKLNNDLKVERDNSEKMKKNFDNEKEEFNTKLNNLNKEIKSFDSERNLIESLKKEIENLKKEIKRIKEETEQIIQDKEFHLKESEKLLKKYSLENARLIVKLQKISAEYKVIMNEVVDTKKSLKSILISLPEFLDSIKISIKTKMELRPTTSN